MQKKPLDKRNDQDQSYAESVANQLRQSNPPKPRPVCPEGMSKEDWYASMQSPSTKALMQKHSDPDYVADLSRPLPDNVLANPNAKTLDEMVNLRKRDPDQEAHIEAIRRRPKNSVGQSILSATTKQAKERAIDHFLHSPPADITKEDENRITKLNQLDAVPAQTQEVWKPMTLWQAVKHWLKGGKVRKSDRQGSWRDIE